MKTNNILAMVALSVCSGLHAQSAQSSRREFVPFSQFLEHTRTVHAHNFTGPVNPVKENSAFEEMRQHVLKTYQGVHVTHSFMLGSSHFDCVPMLQQPAARVSGFSGIAPEPPPSLATRADAANDPAAEGPTKPASSLHGGRTVDEFGNSLHCEDGTIPMRRTTVEDMSRFPTLRQFFEKGPNGAGRALPADSAAAPKADLSSHRYSRMYQIADNLGGNSNLNIWSPYVDTSLGQEFTLSQSWYIGGSGNSMQTVEVGWQNYPRIYGDEYARLFVYWTADNYGSTGCYNLDCGAFVQTNSDITLGGDFGGNYSSPGGTQYDFSAQFYLYNGDWWLSIDGTWIGYFPGTIFNGGQLTRHAQQMQFGSESLATTVWPGEGSGEWSTRGWGQAAYQRNLFYFATDGTPAWNSLTQWNSSPGCYSVSGPFSSNSTGWDVFFYEGGPGGSGC